MKLEKRLELLVCETVEEMAAYGEKLNHKVLGFIDIDIDDWVVVNCGNLAELVETV